MADYSDHAAILLLFREDQAADKDMREKVREVDKFLHEPGGQWEDNVVANMGGRPRYTLDRCNDIVDDIAGEMEQADFDIRVKPAGGEATKDLAKTYDGLIRNIENLSGAVEIFNAAGRSMVSTGFDAWRVSQRWGDNDTFDQDLYIDPIANAVNRVWFDRTSELPTRADGNHQWVLQSMSRDQYEEQFPKGSGQSVDSDSSMDVYGHKSEVVTVGELIYKQKDKTRIVELSNGAVYKDDEKYQAIADELKAQGVTVKRERTRDLDAVKTRLFDGGGWLTEPQDTVFDYLPVVPTYGNFRISDNTAVYWGVITKKMDAQRIYNYTESRKVEEGALAPLEKIVATKEQMGPYQAQWKSLNNSSDPALPYKHQEGQAVPYKLGGAQINPGLESVSQSALMNLQSTAGLDRLQGEPLGLRSGTAVELEQNKGDTRNYKYSASQERAICHTAKILIRAIPKVYDTERQVRILNEDAGFDMVTLNHRVFDEDSGQQVTINDLSVGLYDVTCEVGPAFKNRQEETVRSFLEAAAIDPGLLEIGRDVWYGNITTPGADIVAERVRQQMLLAGQIPETQMTDEEKEFIKAQPEPEPDPVAEALEKESQNESDKIQVQAIEAATKERLANHKIELESANAQAESMKQALEVVNELAAELQSKAATLKILRESQAIEGAAPNAALDQLVTKQAAVVSDSQAEQQ